MPPFLGDREFSNDIVGFVGEGDVGCTILLAPVILYMRKLYFLLQKVSISISVKSGVF